MCNFVLPREKKLPANIGAKQFKYFTGKKPHTKREKEFKNNYGSNDQWAITNWQCAIDNEPLTINN
jgi:hypothetical protein